MKHLLDTRVGPYQAMIPMVDVDTIGAGGGSIAYVDGGGIFRSGPRSAGAAPGPAAYGRGGIEPTSTDAMVNLGWLQPENFLGGAMELRPELARRAFEPLAEALGMSVEEASMGAIQIASHSMVQSIEENSVRKGFDPRDFALVAEGGAGPMFAANIAAEVGTPAVIVPPYPGVTAALGLLVTDSVYEYVTTTYQRMSQLNAVRAPGTLRRSSRSRRAISSSATGSRARSGSSSGSPTAATWARATSCASRPARATSTPSGRPSSRPSSTTRTSASTRAASRNPTSRSRTSGCAASA